MHLFPALGLTAALAAAVLPAHAATLEDAAAALGANGTKSLAYSGTGDWFQFGQAPNPSLPWPRFNVTRYAADINFDTASARVQITRSQALEAKRERPAPVEQRVDQYVSGASAWSVATAP
ncbi:MAG: MBL fold metallo-hydrolase, partial [Burkholderiaceae bacterium]|nr:MBL fold metallo-hydrolase [Burkholderiaceae bacterium]